MNATIRRRPQALVLGALLVGALLLLPGSLAGAEPPGAYGLLAAVREAYPETGAYADQGVIERTTLRGGEAVAVERLRFVTRRGADGSFLFRLEGEEAGRTQVIWSPGGGAGSHYSEALGQVRPVTSLAGAVAESLGEGGEDLLVVARLLAPGAASPADRLPDPPAAASEGPVPCGISSSSCYRLETHSLGGAVAVDYLVDVATYRLHRVAVRLASRDEVFAAAAREAGLPAPTAYPGSGNDEATHLVLTFESVHTGDELEGGTAVADTAFEPPPATRRVETWQPTSQAEPQARFEDAVDVRLRTVQVRALEYDGTPIEGLRPEDFRVRVGRQPVVVQAADWFGAGESRIGDVPPEVLAATGVTVPSPGRLVLVYLQSGIVATRGPGHLRLLKEIQPVLDGLDRDDRVAVVSFDSHLKLRLDFTRDLEAVRHSFEEAVFRRPVERLRPGRLPSLARHLDFDEARDAATPEEGLLLAARALEPLPGDKLMIFMGWGLGNYHFGGVSMPHEYDEALEILRRTRTSVFVLDVTQVDFHTLELGLKQVAADTGGQYFSTYKFPRQVVSRLVRSLGGYYELTFECPPLARETPLDVRLPGREARLLYVESLPPDF